MSDLFDKNDPMARREFLDHHRSMPLWVRLVVWLRMALWI